jgi:hypothetical protein
MTSTKYIGMDVHKESISIAVMNAAGKIWSPLDRGSALLVSEQTGFVANKR